MVLLLGITVLLAGTAASFFIGITDDRQHRAPATAVTVDYTANDGADDSLSVRHRTGDPISPTQLFVRLSGATCEGGSDDPNGTYNAHEDFGIAESNDVAAGMALVLNNDSPTLCSSGTLDVGDASLKIVWESPSGESSVVHRWTAP